MSIQYIRGTIQDTENGADVAEINDELQKIQSAFQNALNRNFGQSSPNQMQSTLDMNSNPIINLPFAVSQSSPVTLGQVNALIADLATIDLGPFVVPNITGSSVQQSLINLLSALDAIGLINDNTTLNPDFSSTVLDLTLAYQAVINAPIPVNSRREIIITTRTVEGAVTVLPDPGYITGDRLILVDATTSWDENPITVDFPSAGYNYYGDAATVYTGSTSGNRATFTYINPTIGFIGA